MFFKRKINTDTSLKTINNILERGVEKIFPGKDFLEMRLKSGERMKFYLGIDPTGPSLHLGHSICLKKLKDLQKAGHEIILLIGDFTARIGDPTDKNSTRKKISKEEVNKNFQNYKKQASKYLDFKGHNPVKIMYNNDWLGKMTFEEVIELSSKVTVDQMLKRNMFEERIKSEKPIYLHEFLYPIMQGYDSVAMDVDGEVGGNDQTFNMLVGRDLQKSIQDKEKVVIAMKLLVDPTGKKMGKSEGNMVTLSDEPRQIFGKVMSWPDGLIVNAFTLLTDILDEDILNIKKEIENGSNPKDFKVKLAKEIISILYNKEDADLAEKNFINTFKNNHLPDDAKEIFIEKGSLLRKISNEVGLSGSEWARLLDSEAIKTVKGEVIRDLNYKVITDIDLRIGKKIFVKIKIK